MTVNANGRPRAVLWDLDGTLIDSRDQHWRAWRETMRAEGVTITEAEFLASFGRRNSDVVGDWLDGRATRERILEVGAEKEVRWRALVARDGVVELPGTAAWIARLDRTGWRQAVASSAPRANVEAVLDVVTFHGPLRTIVAAEDVGVGKPEPDVFLIAADRLGADPSRCVVVEDAAAGVEAARRAGMPVIGVGGREVGDADVVVDSLAELPDDAFDRLVPPAPTAPSRPTGEE